MKQKTNGEDEKKLSAKFIDAVGLPLEVPLGG